MKITDVIRKVLDVIDQAETEQVQPDPVTAEVEITNIPVTEPDELARLKQIAGLVGTEEQAYSNSPDEKVADIDAVTASGTDVHHSKHPADIRSNATSMYPFYQARPNGE